MKFTTVAGAALLAAAAAVAGGRMAGVGPNTATLDDQVDVKLVAAATPTVAVTPEPVVRRHGTVDLTANIDLVLVAADGSVKDVQHYGNIILDTGKDRAIRLLLGDTGSCPTTVPTPCGVPGTCLSPAKYNWVCIGSDATAESAAQTACINEGGLTANVRQQDTSPDFTATGVGKIIVSFGAGVGTGGINEVALLSCGAGACSPSGLSRKKLTTGITKAAGDTLSVTYTITQG